MEGTTRDQGAALLGRRQLSDPEQVAEFVRRFYSAVDQDDLLGPMFNEVARVDWPTHLKKLTGFWCRALFGISGYEGNPFRAHALVHAQRAFTLAHFERWLGLFYYTLDAGWEGPEAEQARELVAKVAVMHARHLLKPAV